MQVKSRTAGPADLTSLIPRLKSRVSARQHHDSSAPVTPALLGTGAQAAALLPAPAYKAEGWTTLAELVRRGVSRTDVLTLLGEGVRVPNPFVGPELRLYPREWALAQLSQQFPAQVNPWEEKYGQPVPGHPSWLTRSDVQARGWQMVDHLPAASSLPGSVHLYYPADEVLKLELRGTSRRFCGLSVPAHREGRLHSGAASLSGTRFAAAVEHGAQVGLSGAYLLPDHRPNLIQVGPGRWRFHRHPFRDARKRHARTPEIGYGKVAQQLLQHSPVWALHQASASQRAGLDPAVLERANQALGVHAAALIQAYWMFEPALRAELSRMGVTVGEVPAGSLLEEQLLVWASDDVFVRYVHTKALATRPLLLPEHLQHESLPAPRPEPVAPVHVPMWDDDLEDQELQDQELQDQELAEVDEITEVMEVELDELSDHLRPTGIMAEKFVRAEMHPSGEIHLVFR